MGQFPTDVKKAVAMFVAVGRGVCSLTRQCLCGRRSKGAWGSVLTAWAGCVLAPLGCALLPGGSCRPATLVVLDSPRG